MRRPDVDAFLAELVEVCRKHGFSLGHEDNHGAFLVEKFDVGNLEWLLDALDETNPPPPRRTTVSLAPFVSRTGDVLFDRRVPEMQDNGQVILRDPKTGVGYTPDTGEEIR